MHLKNCAIMEETADGDTVGRCFYSVGDDNICPRHGDVTEVQRRYRETGQLTLDSHHERVFPKTEHIPMYKRILEKLIW